MLCAALHKVMYPTSISHLSRDNKSNSVQKYENSGVQVVNYVYDARWPAKGLISYTLNVEPYTETLGNWWLSKWELLLFVVNFFFCKCSKNEQLIILQIMLQKTCMQLWACMESGKIISDTITKPTLLQFRLESF